MKTLKKLFGAAAARFSAAAPSGFLMTFVLGILFVIFGLHDDMMDFAVCGAVMLIIGTIMLLTAGFRSVRNDSVLSSYDKELIDGGFHMGIRKNILTDAVRRLREGEFNEALEVFRELKNDGLSDSEQGVLSFYTAICYNHMGYPTNAGHAAAEAAEKDVSLPDSLLMAARSFSMAGSRSMAAEYYERLLPIAEERFIFPFIYNEMGKMYIADSKPEKARLSFQKAMDNGLDPVTAQGGMALACLMEKKTDEACEWYRLALISGMSDTEGFKKYCGQICTAHGYPDNFLETHLRKKFEAERAEVTAHT